MERPSNLHSHSAFPTFNLGTTHANGVNYSMDGTF